MGIVSGGGGGGGNPTPPVTLTGTNRATVPLTVRGAPTQNADFFAVKDGGGNSILELGADGAGAADFIAIAGGDSDSSFATGRNLVLSGSGVILGIGTNGFVVRTANAAPTDAVLNPGNFGLWLDQTPGATKLMIKAQDSGGTTRTAAIALA